MIVLTNFVIFFVVGTTSWNLSFKFISSTALRYIGRSISISFLRLPGITKNISFCNESGLLIFSFSYLLKSTSVIGWPTKVVVML